MFDLPTLRQYIALARHENLPDAAEELHLTPSALSKTLKKLEQSLATTLFERDGRQLKINADGVRFAQRAAALLAHAQQVHSEFLGKQGSFRCRVAGPALLQLNWGRQIAAALVKRYPAAYVSFGDEEEEVAVAALRRGEADLALISSGSSNILDSSLEVIDVGTSRFEVAIGAKHPLAQACTNGSYRAVVSDVLRHDFVVPTRPTFRALAGGPATDGWRDDQLPRVLRYRSNDLVMVDGLVRAGLALAYLPDYVLPEFGLDRLELTDFDFPYQQQVLLAYRPSEASGWVNYLIDVLRASASTSRMR